MGFYDDAKTAESYIEMAKGYDGQELIAELQKILPPQSSVLELGSGPGVDLDLLKKRSQATGSDSSQFFVERYNARNPKSRMIVLDAITLLTDIQFDCHILKQSSSPSK